MMRTLNLLLGLGMSLFVLTGTAQDKPSDFLTNKFHKERRELLREKMPDNSVAVFFSNPVRNRANDVDFVYHQNPNFFYLTGYPEPHAVLLVFKELMKSPDGSTFNEMIFVYVAHLS